MKIIAGTRFAPKIKATVKRSGKVSIIQRIVDLINNLKNK